MASANLELVRSILADWERGDYSSAEWAHPDIEYVLDGGPDAGRTTGARAMARSYATFLSSWREWRLEVEEYRELDGERVLALIRGGGRGKTSGLKVEYEGALLFHVRDAVVTEVVNYTHRQRALADLGLAPDADAADSP
jgi:ketosteroid isomerase-like protein